MRQLSLTTKCIAWKNVMNGVHVQCNSVDVCESKIRASKRKDNSWFRNEIKEVLNRKNK